MGTTRLLYGVSLAQRVELRFPGSILQTQSHPDVRLCLANAHRALRVSSWWMATVKPECPWSKQL
jgi:hypothetical protein